MIIKKITDGYVIQSFDTDKQEWINQRFVAGDQTDYESENGKIYFHDFLDKIIERSTEPYLPFDMVQP